MRSHNQIVSDIGVGPLRLGLAEKGISVADPTVRSWARRNDGQGSIPPEYWQSLVDLGFASLEELAAAEHATRFGAEAEGAAA